MDGFSYLDFSVEARSLEVGGIIPRASKIRLSRWPCAWSLSGRVGWPSHRIMRVKEQRVHLCLRTHLCTIICPSQMVDLRWDWPPWSKSVRRTIYLFYLVISDSWFLDETFVTIRWWQRLVPLLYLFIYTLIIFNYILSTYLKLANSDCHAV